MPLESYQMLIILKGHFAPLQRHSSFPSRGTSSQPCGRCTPRRHIIVISEEADILRSDRLGIAHTSRLVSPTYKTSLDTLPSSSFFLSFSFLHYDLFEIEERNFTRAEDPLWRPFTLIDSHSLPHLFQMLPS